MRKMRIAMIIIAALMLVMTLASCKKTTEPETDTPAGMVYVPGHLHHGRCEWGR
jgi:outer membrane protein assembly factor BamE (lipoprotein component of BamABCDE complex)